jgi:hypothetical protein
MTAPRRLQLSRRKGFNLQAHSLAVNGLPAVNCARPSKYGNPFLVAHDWQASFRAVALGERGDRQGRARATVKLYALWLRARRRTVKVDRRDFWQREVLTVKAPKRPTRREIRRALAGKNLACWCRPGEPCHVDVLLEIANV